MTITKQKFTKVSVAWDLVGGLSKPSKLPCFSYSLPAQECKLGSLLRKKANSTCSKCYALKGFYVFPNTAAALRKRMEAIEKPIWSFAMAFLINYYYNKKGLGFFRWHDSGDLQSVKHLEKIAAVCRMTPKVKHWLPTREYGIVREFLAIGGKIPRNLTIRLSAHFMDSNPPQIEGLTTSTVHKNSESVGWVCPAQNQGHKCLSCRACWDKNIENVSYAQH